MADLNYKYLTNSGVIVPDTADLRTQVETEWRNSLGDDLNTDPGTPQGVMITGEVIARASVAEQNAAIANQIHPDYAGGVFLDALCAMLGLARYAATRSIVTVNLFGTNGTVIPAGARVSSAAGDIFELLTPAIIGAGNFAEAQARAQEFGPVNVNVGTITNVLDSVLGWTGVSNTTAGVLGRTRESDAQLRQRRRHTLALQGISTVEAQVSSLYALEGVRSLQFRENIASTQQVIDGISMLPHSVWACVDGGADIDVATSLLNNKTDGAAWNGSHTVNVLEPYSGQTYPVTFDRPVEVLIQTTVTVRVTGSLLDPSILIPQVVVDYANGLVDGETGFVVGVNVSPFEISGAIARQFPNFFIAKVEVARNGQPLQTTELPIAINEVPRITQGLVTVILA